MITSESPSTAETASSQVFEDTLAILELPEVLEEVASHAGSTPGQWAVLESVPASEEPETRRRLRIVTELRETIQLDGTLGFADLLPFEGLLERLDNEAVVLDTEEIVAVRDMLATVQTVRDRLGDLEERFELLREMSRRFRPLDPLRFKIDAVLDSHGAIRADASQRLSEIRDRTGSLRRRIYGLLEGIVEDRQLARVVQEDYVTLRNDRYVVLLRPEFKGLMEGIVHDHSRSGASVYVEPMEVVPLNNQVASVLDEEREEVLRILRQLTEDIRFVKEDIDHDYRLLAFMDAFQARALYAARTDSIEPELVEEGFSIVDARHPLLLTSEGTEVVPMHVIQDPGTRITIISGANMGGKTVALKITGLFNLMARCGIMLPAREGTKIHLFPRIMADIGEEQDIRGKVSSFSGHLDRLNRILDNALSGDLVLLDELGGSTDPEEGAALAMAVMDELADRGASVVVTTHLTRLKAYALGHDAAKNVSVEFHPETLQPTYRLLYDLPGESHAIQTAERMGLPASVIERARGYVDKSVGGSSRLLESLRKKIEEVDELKRTLEHEKAELEARVEEMHRDREVLAEEFRKQGREVIKRAEKELADLQRSLKKGRPKGSPSPQKVVEEVRGDMEQTFGRPIEPPQPDLAPGARVRVKTLGKVGQILDVREGGRVDVAVGKIRITADADDLEVLERAQKKSSSKNDQVRVDIPLTSARAEVNVVGLRVSDALPIVDKTVDEAVLGGLSRVSIIHGKGTGRLKEAIWDHLSGLSIVRDLHHADPNTGGAGVTVVELEAE